MQVVQTAGVPPNQGRIALARIGWTWKSRKALSRIVTPNVAEAEALLKHRLPALVRPR